MSLLTLSAPAIWAAFASTACFSLSELTGPFKVTMPFCAMILTLWAFVDRDLDGRNAAADGQKPSGINFPKPAAVCNGP